MLFDAGHEVFSYIQPGDCLEVTANAMCPAWVNYAERGSLEVFTQWEPSPKMMGLIYGGLSQPALEPVPNAKVESTAPVAVPVMALEDAISSEQPSSSNARPPPLANDEFAARFQSLRERLKSRFG